MPSIMKLEAHASPVHKDEVLSEKHKREAVRRPTIHERASTVLEDPIDWLTLCVHVSHALRAYSALSLE